MNDSSPAVALSNRKSRRLNLNCSHYLANTWCSTWICVVCCLLWNLLHISVQVLYLLTWFLSRTDSTDHIILPTLMVSMILEDDKVVSGDSQVPNIKLLNTIWRHCRPARSIISKVHERLWRFNDIRCVYTVFYEENANVFPVQSSLNFTSKWS